MTNHDRMNCWWRRATRAEAELDSWMARAYEAEGKLWKAEARIKAVEDLCDDADKRHASVLIVTTVRRALDGEA